MREILLSVLIAVISYLLGCFSTGLTVSNVKGVDIRNAGSKNTGASNVLRVMGLKSGLVTFIGDFLKATLSCWLGSLILPDATWGIMGYGMMLGGLFAIIGHNWPVFYGFKGGKGVACSAAVIFFINPLWGIISIVICVGVIALTRYISLGQHDDAALLHDFHVRDALGAMVYLPVYHHSFRVVRMAAPHKY